jgi:hypothetical protein
MLAGPLTSCLPWYIPQEFAYPMVQNWTSHLGGQLVYFVAQKLDAYTPSTVNQARPPPSGKSSSSHGKDSPQSTVVGVHGTTVSDFSETLGFVIERAICAS